MKNFVLSLLAFTFTSTLASAAEFYRPNCSEAIRSAMATSESYGRVTGQIEELNKQRQDVNRRDRRDIDDALSYLHSQLQSLGAAKDRALDVADRQCR